MLRFFSAIVAMTMLTMLSANFAAASDFGGCDGCLPGDFPPYWVPRVHKFRPLPRDGVPVVTNLRLYPKGIMGLAASGRGAWWQRLAGGSRPWSLTACRIEARSGQAVNLRGAPARSASNAAFAAVTRATICKS
jgi:hypothetical protein